MKWDFESQFSSQDNIPEINVPAGVRAWWLEGWFPELDNGKVYARPEIVPSRGYDYRLKDGTQSLKLFNWSNIHRAGIQMRTGSVAGGTYTFSAWIQVWTANNEDSLNGKPISSGDKYNYGTRVGIDPRGGEDALSADIVWSDWVVKDNWDVFLKQEVSVIAQASHVTCFVEGRCKFAVRHNDMYIDACELVGISPEPGPDPEPGNDNFDAVMLYTADAAIAWGKGVKDIIAPQSLSAKFMRKVRNLLK